MNTRYTIHFSLNNPNAPTRLALSRIRAALADVPAYTLYRAYGTWEHQPEDSYTLEIVGQSTDEPRILTTAKVLKEHFNQSAVLITKSTVSTLIV